MSESSFNSKSSAGSTAQHVAKPGEDEVFESAGTSIQTGVCGVLYTVAKERTPSISFVALKLFMEWLQLFLLMVNPWYGYNGFIDYNNSGWFVISFVHLRNFMTTRGYTFYVICLYIFSFTLLAICGLCAYIYHAFSNNHFEITWPVKLVRWYVVIVLQIFDIASMLLLLISVDCSYWNGGAFGYNAEFPSKACWVMPHLIHAAVAMFALAVFIVLAVLFSVAEMDLNLLTRNYYALGNSSIEVTGFLIKFVLVGNCIFLTDMRWKAAMQFIFSLWLLTIYVKWLPHTYTAVNVVRCASYASVLFTTLPLIILSFQANVVYDDPNDLVDFNSKVTAAMWACLIPAALAGAALAFWRHRYFAVQMIERFRTAPAGTKTKLIFKFSHPREAEIMVRCCRSWSRGWNNAVDHDALEPDAAKLAETVIKAGISQLSTHSYMIILWSSYLIDVMQSYQSGYSQLQGAKKTNPNFLERFAIFSREQDHTQKQSEQNQGDNAVDVVSFVEFQRNHKMVLKVHKDALTSMKVIWKLVQRTKVSFKDLAQAIKKMNETVRIAEKVYRQVLNRHVNSARLLKLYSLFLFEVKNDPWAAAKWLADAEVLYHEEDKNKDNEFSAFQYAIDRATGANNADMELRMRERRAVIIMNGNSTIQMAQGCEEMFGYTRNKELHGKNVNVLMPPPMCDQHAAHVRSHITTGKRTIIEQTTKLIAVRKDRYAFQMKLLVTHLSGVGEDSLYMGVIEPLARQRDVSTAWILPNGQIAGVDVAFNDWLGYKAVDVVGTNIRKILVDAVVLESVMERVEFKAGSGAPLEAAGSVVVELDDGRLEEVWYVVDSAGLVTVPDRVVLHQFHEPLKVDVTLERFGIGSFHLYALSFRRRGPEQMLLVTDRQGRLRHVTAALAALLGGGVEALKADGAANAIDALLPEPFCQLHHGFRGEAAAPRPPHFVPPLRSCFAGVAVCLRSVAASSVEAPRMLPCRLRINYREVAPSDVCQVVTIDPVTLDEALNERRLKLTVNSLGAILSAGECPTSLFGFAPQVLVGMNLSDSVDVFRNGARDAEHDAALSPKLAGQPLIKAMLLKLAEQSVNCPGVSWRVGVLDPAPLPACLSSLEAVAKVHEAEHTKPAAMTVKVTAYSATAVDRAVRELQVTDVDEAEEILFELELWRAELICSVLELDAQGKIVGGDQVNPLCPAGLLLGSGSSLQDKHISVVIPQMELGVQELFTGALVQGAPGKLVKQGSRRRSAGGGGGGGLRGAEPSRANGPLLALTLQHRGDGARVTMSAQAVWKTGSHSNALLVLHAVRPSCGREDFARWLLDPALARSASCRAGGPSPAPGARPMLKKKSFMSPETSKMPSVLSASRRSESHMLSAPRPDPTGPKSISIDGAGTGLRAPPGASRAMLEQDDSRLGVSPDPEAMSSAEDASLFNADKQDISATTRATSGGLAVKKNFSVHTRTGLAQVGDAGSDDGDADGSGDQGNAVVKARLDQWLSNPGGIGADDPSEPLDGPGDDAASVASDRGRRSSNAGQQQGLQEADMDVDEATNTFTDYKRGKRFKRLLKALSNAQTTNMLRRFKLHMILTVSLLFMAHLACFATMVVLLTQVQDDVTDLQSSAFANRKVYEQAIDIHCINTILKNKTSPKQPLFNGPAQLPSFVDDLDVVSSKFKPLHQGVYLGFRAFKRLPTKYGIRDIWETPCINVTMYFDSAPTMTVNTTLMGLWDLGNLYLEKSRNLWTVASMAINATDPNNVVVDTSKVSIADMADYHFVMVNGPNAINHYYQITLNGLMQVTVEHSNNVNLVHLLIVAAEGVLLTFVAACWVWRITQEVVYLRYDMYNCFLQIPIATLRSLAEKPMQLDEDEEDEEDEGIKAEDAADAAAQAPGLHAADDGKPAGVRMKVSMAGMADPGDEALGPEVQVEEPKGSFSRLRSWFGRSFGRVSPVAQSKRRLTKSNASAMWMVSPFAMWALMVILMNSINFVLLDPLGDSICLLNIVNFMLIRHHIMFFNVIELLSTNAGLPGITYGAAAYLKPEQTASAAARFAYELQAFETEYSAMLYSGSSLNDPDPHFSMSSTGIAITQNSARALLYSTQSCLREDPTACLPDDDTSGFLDITHNGLDGLLKGYVQSFTDMLLSDPATTDFGASSFTYVITLGQNDIEGGIVLLSEVYFLDVLANYQNTNTLQIIQLVFVTLLALIFIFFFALPFIGEVWVEVRRIAELLAHLPPEIDIDSIVARTVGGAAPPPVAAGPTKSSRSMRVPRSSSKVVKSDW